MTRQPAPRLPSRPGWSHERRIARAGYGRIAGLDEVGRGCLAGPVVAAAVIMRPGRRLTGLNDSKLLSAAQREGLVREILRGAEAWSLGCTAAEEVDRVNVLNATCEAMRRAIEALPVRPDHLLIDALRLPAVPIPQTSLVKGDRISVSIAAASVLAKVMRDRVMSWYDRMYPGFEFADHKGYGTSRHVSLVAQLGVSPIHRRTFRGVWQQYELGFPRAERQE